MSLEASRVPSGKLVVHTPSTTLTSVSHPSITSGTHYWFVVAVAAGTEQWAFNDTGVTGGAWLGNTVNTLSPTLAANATPGLQLNSQVSSVPEPARLVCWPPTIADRLRGPPPLTAGLARRWLSGRPSG